MMSASCYRRSTSILSLYNRISSTCSTCLSTSARKCQSPDTIEHVDATQLPVTETPSQLAKRKLPLVTSRKLHNLPFGLKPKQTWLETLDTIEDEKLGMIDLHPDVFGAFPRIDILYRNIHWQRTYRKIDYRNVPTRAELSGGGRKPWPQKGTGRARHGSIRSPLWNKGGKSFGPRGPTSYFFMLPKNERILGLRTALSIKFAQNDLHVVESLDLPTGDPEYLEELIETRGWGLSALFIHDTDVMPVNLAMSTDKRKPYTVMPLYGLNVYSMLKHETLVMSLPALELLEQKLVDHMHSQKDKDQKFTRTPV